MEKPRKRVQGIVRFSPEVWAALEAEAARQNRSVSNMVETLTITALEAMDRG